MKKLLTILTCLVLATAAFGQWEAVHGPVWYNNPADAVAVDDSTFLTVSKGVVGKTVDFGETWTEIELPITLSANEIDANGDVVVIVYDDAYVYKSVDAGDSFTQIGDTANFITDLHQVQVFDANTYFVTGEDGLFMKTVDGGANWDTTVVDAAFDLDGGVGFTSLTNGIAVQDGNDATYWRTTDGGDTWTPLVLTWPFGTISKRMYDVSAVAGTNTIMMVGYHNLIWISTDGGATFAQSGDMSYGYDRNDGCKAFSATDMVVVTDNSVVLSTDDGGTTWDTTSIGSGQSHQANAFNSLTRGMVFAAYEQKFKTADGETYVPMQAWPAISFWGIAFPAEGEVMVSAYGGGELTSSMDGMAFTYPSNDASETVENIYELHFIDENVGLFGGGYGLLKKTEDGGATWTQIENPMSLGTNKHINMMYVADDGKVYAGGSSGMIMVSEDDGDTWEELENTASQTIYDMKILSNGMAMLVCSSGQFSVSKTTALDTFEMVADYGTMAFRSIDERNGVVIVGASDDIYKTTTDALDTLVAVFDVPGGDDIYGVSFVDDTTVYAVGQDGRIFVSMDAGDTWEAMHSEAEMYESDLQHCDFDGEYMWAVGKSGLIMKHKVETVKADYVEEFADGDADLTWMENTAAANAGGLNLTVAADSAGLTNVGIWTDDDATGLIYADLGRKVMNYEVSADVYVVKEPSPTEPLYKGIAIKMDPVDMAYYRLVYRNSSSSYNGAIKLQGFNGASWFISQQWIAGEDFDTLETGFHNLKAQVVDNKFWCYVDDELLPGCPFTHDGDPVVEAGYPGMYVYTGMLEFDNFKVKVLEYPAYNVTANVDMGVMVRREEFDPASSALDIIGTFDGWSGTPMTDVDGDTIYTASLGDHEAGTVIAFKCRRNGAWDNTEEFPSGGANREYTVTDDGDQVIPTFLYGDIDEVAIDGVPATFALEQNYPNPFNPATTVKFQIPNAEMVSINVYDISGRKVAEVMNTQLEAGYYSVNFNASVLPSGVYLYRITAGEYSDVKKMTLLK